MEKADTVNLRLIDFLLIYYLSYRLLVFLLYDHYFGHPAFQLNRYNFIWEFKHGAVAGITMTKVDEEMKTAQLQADLILGGVLGTTLGPSP